MKQVTNSIREVSQKHGFKLAQANLISLLFSASVRLKNGRFAVADAKLGDGHFLLRRYTNFAVQTLWRNDRPQFHFRCQIQIQPSDLSDCLS